MTERERHAAMSQVVERAGAAAPPITSESRTRGITGSDNVEQRANQAAECAPLWRRARRSERRLTVAAKPAANHAARLCDTRNRRTRNVHKRPENALVNQSAV